jgi:hypothetical protein
MMHPRKYIFGQKEFQEYIGLDVCGVDIMTEI